jgi:F420-dependent oxidoreductase-like protein
MELVVFTEPQQGASYDTLLSVARAAEAGGFTGFFRSDHFVPIWAGDGRPGPTDAWVTLAGLARETARIRLGTLLTSATFRLPGPLAVAVAQIDQMSGGRVEFGIGAGWYAREHEAYGISFPPLGERFDRLEEQLAVVTGLWATPEGKTFSHPGRYYPVVDSPALPKPLQRPRPPVIVGGIGPVRTPRLAATYADEYNVPFAPLSAARGLYAKTRDVCEAAGRDPASLRLSCALIVCCGADEAEYTRRAAAIGEDPAALRTHQAGGTPAELVERLNAFTEAGAVRAYLQVRDLADLDHLALIAAEVMPHLG